MPQLPQLLPNGFLAQKSVFKKHLMEQIINLFEYTSNLISGASPPGQAARLSLDIALGNREWGEGPSLGKEGHCAPSPPPSRPGPSYVHPAKKSQRKERIT